MSKRQRPSRGSTYRAPQPENFGETVHRWSVFTENAAAVMYAQLLDQQVERGTVLDWSFLRDNDLEQGFLQSFRTDGFTGPQWEQLFRMREPVYDELVRELLLPFVSMLLRPGVMWAILGSILGWGRVEDLLGYGFWIEFRVV